MSLLRVRALEMLAQCLANSIAPLSAGVEICAGPAEANHKLEFPHLALIPAIFNYLPDQGREYTVNGVAPDVGARTIVMDVGRFEVLVQLRLGTKTARQRYDIEDRISNLFLSQPMSPGVLVVEIPNCMDAYASFEYQDHSWGQERAFEKEWYSTTTINAIVPALVTRSGVNDIDQFVTTITEDMTSLFINIPASSLESKSVDSSGTLSLYV